LFFLIVFSGSFLVTTISGIYLDLIYHSILVASKI
jgi:hypothetical protein